MSSTPRVSVTVPFGDPESIGRRLKTAIREATNGHADPQFLSAKLGSAGLHFHTLAQAEDPRPVIGRRASKSVGSEHTLDKDVREKADIKFHLRRSADAIGRRLRKKSYVAFGVGVKLKTANFQILTPSAPAQ